MHYVGLASTPVQLRYDDICRAFFEVADLDVDDEARSSTVMDCIKVQAKELKSSCCTHSNHVLSHGSDSLNHFGINVLNSLSSKRKGAPRKL